MLRAAGLPEPEAQYEIHAAGRLVARVDFAYPELLLAIEVDGYRWHSARHHLDRDRDRRNDLTELRWRILHITHEATSGPRAASDRLGAEGAQLGIGATSLNFEPPTTSRVVPATKFGPAPRAPNS